MRTNSSCAVVGWLAVTLAACAAGGDPASGDDANADSHAQDARVDAGGDGTVGRADAQEAGDDSAGDSGQDAGDESTDDASDDASVDSSVDSGVDSSVDSGDDASSDAAEGGGQSDASDASIACGPKVIFMLPPPPPDSGPPVCGTGENYTCGNDAYMILCSCPMGSCSCTKNNAPAGSVAYGGCPLCSQPNYAAIAAACGIQY
jgi:hypothetical protein